MREERGKARNEEVEKGRVEGDKRKERERKGRERTDAGKARIVKQETKFKKGQKGKGKKAWKEGWWGDSKKGKTR